MLRFDLCADLVGGTDGCLTFDDNRHQIKGAPPSQLQGLILGGSGLRQTWGESGTSSRIERGDLRVEICGIVPLEIDTSLTDTSLQHPKGTVTPTKKAPAIRDRPVQ
jgi:hypothetical protein